MARLRLRLGYRAFPTQFIGAGQLAQTVELKDYPGSVAPAGYLLADGKTTGNATSGGTERANADTANLFSLLWSSIPSLTVSGGGRGASAAADFAASKTITLPDLRGRVLTGLDNMGSSAAGNITDGTTLGGTSGDQSHTLSTGEMPARNHTATVADNGHTHGVNCGSTGGDAHNNLQSYMFVSKIIKL
jgi:hypothetical protein